MSKSTNQKQKLLYILKFLMENTDEDHAVRTPQIIEYLAKQGISAERKSIYDDMNTLTDFGIDIIKAEGPFGGYMLASRDFELAEVKLLVDLVQSSKFLTTKKSRELIKKLETQVSRYDAGKLQRQVEVADRVKTDNESIYYNVDLIHQGIADNRQISFQYFDWSVDKKMRYRKDGRRYRVSPWLLTWNEENYYLVAYEENEKAIRHYRVDKMDKLEVEEEKRNGKTDFEAKDISTYAKKTFGMFAGEEKTVHFVCEEKMVGVMIDRFGRDVPLRKLEDGTIRVRANVEISPQFYGWLSGFGTQVRMVEPKEEVERYKEYLQKIVQEYKAGD